MPGSRDDEVGHLVVRQAGDGPCFVRISRPFAHGFELSSCSLARSRGAAADPLRAGTPVRGASDHDSSRRAASGAVKVTRVPLALVATSIRPPSWAARARVRRDPSPLGRASDRIPVP